MIAGNRSATRGTVAARRQARASAARRSVAILGVPFNSAGVDGGVAGMPGSLRAAGLIERLQTSGRKVVDAEDLRIAGPSRARDPITGLRNSATLASTTRSVGQATSVLLRGHYFPLLLGGDCAILLGALSALESYRDRPGLLFIDGHEDAWPPLRSPTGEASDSELGIVLGISSSPIARARLIDPDALAIVGPRDREELEGAGVTSLAGSTWFRDASRVTRDGAGPTAKAAISHLRGASGGWWLHTDLDVLDSNALSAVDYPQPGGLAWGQLSEMTALALQSPLCVGWSIAIYNPDLDDDESAVRIVSFMADVTRWLH